ncbi:sigma-70 family RNA polymerase sigma factor [Candidatus Poribacteria bacterium]|nr:sigma-70 family RNA polymerase sigma factor [Candidatus Poribacteria bacterium]
MENLKSLVIRAQAGDLDAYSTLVQQFQDMAVGYACSILGDFHLAQDAAQEAFIEAYNNLSKLREPVAFPGWFRRIVFKHCDRLTRGVHIETVSLEAAAEMPSGEKDPAEAAEEREMKDNVLAAIQALPENERAVTTLFYINGYSQKEIGEFLGVPVKAVKNRLYSARNRLREGMMALAKDNLQEQRPSKDETFKETIMSAIKPVIPLPSNLFFPQMIFPLNIVRELSIRAAKHALNEDGVLLFLAQKNREKATPAPDDLHRVGIVGKIVDSYDPHDGTIRIAVEAESRATAIRCFEENGYLQAEVEMIPEAKARSKTVKALMERAIGAFEKYLFKESQPFVLIRVEKGQMTLEMKHGTTDTAAIIPLARNSDFLEMKHGATDTPDKILEATALMKTAINAFEEYIKEIRMIEEKVGRQRFFPEPMIIQVKKDGTIGTDLKEEAAKKADEILNRRIDHPGHLADSIASHFLMNRGADRLQRILYEIDPIKRLQVVVDFLEEGLDR